MDDALDYEYASSTLGKPSGADLNLGLTTAPALYAWEEHPEMGHLIRRKFERPGDVDLVIYFFPLLLLLFHLKTTLVGTRLCPPLIGCPAD